MIRLLLREDAKELAALYVANRAFTAPFSPIQPASFFTVKGQRDSIAAREYLYAILDGESIAGVIGINNVVHAAFRSASLGYFVDGARNGQGLATRAVAEAVGIAFDEIGLHRVEAATLVDNVASQRVLERNGFTSIGLAPRYIRIAGEWRDHLLFQRTVED